MTPGLSQPPTSHALCKSVGLGVIAALYFTTMMAPSMRVTFTGTTDICLCFIKAIDLAPSSVCYSTSATYLSSCSFMYLCVPCYCHACFGLLRCVWVWKRYTIRFICWQSHLFLQVHPSIWHRSFYGVNLTALELIGGRWGCVCTSFWSAQRPSLTKVSTKFSTIY